MTRLPRTALAAALVGGLAPLVVTAPSAAAEAATAYYVSPSGSDANSGTSAGAPLATIQKAVDLAPSGAVVNLAPGAYRQHVVTARAGVTITGPSNAVVKGAGDARVILGTAPEQQGSNGAPDAGADISWNNRIHHNTTVHDNVGAGVRLGGDTATDGTATSVYGNTITGNAGGGIKFMRTPQGPVCSNTMSGNTGGDAVGTYGSSYDPTGVCPK